MPMTSRQVLDSSNEERPVAQPMSKARMAVVEALPGRSSATVRTGKFKALTGPFSHGRIS